MQSKERKDYVCMGYRHREKGFTFVTLLLMITILSSTLPFLSYLIQFADYEPNYDEISAQQFFHFIRNDVIKSTTIEASGKKLYLNQKYEDVTATIELYGSLIRRQVNGQGHEVYLRDVKDISFTSLPFGIHVSVTMLTGAKHEKTIIHYQ
ncbi:competence type IV pilus minor pilin ComGF [Oceanobacillus longus]|uniref:Competence type IV pilus minor pilin ComGF n=1 Tax=Oceanobacillus longus TaxID=930120 RepID=A0ABV8GSV8_9BACI